MADNYLITGYWGEPHVTAENDRGINAAMFGAGRFVLPVGEQFRAEYIGSNTIRMYDGKLMDNGAAAGIPAGEYVDLLIANAGQGMNRNDLIVFQYEQDASTLIESGRFVVIRGTEASGTASDPELSQEDLLSGEATFDQMALWRVPVSGASISAPVKVFSVSAGLDQKAPAGYGLGEPSLVAPDNNDANNAIRNGRYSVYGSTENAPGVDGVMTVDSRAFGQAYQTIKVHGTGCKLQRFQKSGVWSEWEWINPPMHIGVEYRTTERWNGKAVYTKLVNCGNLPNASTKTVAHGASVSQIIRCNGQCTSNYTPIPRDWNGGIVAVFADKGNIMIKTNVDYSDQTACVQIWYTKD